MTSGDGVGMTTGVESAAALYLTSFPREAGIQNRPLYLNRGAPVRFATAYVPCGFASPPL